MELTYHCPKFKYGCNPPAVYKMTFDTGHFYIGSSQKVKTRMVLWRTCLKRNNFKSKLISAILGKAMSVRFEILELIPEPERLLKETEHIKANYGNPLFLNKIRTAMGDGSTIEQSKKERYLRTYVKTGRIKPYKVSKHSIESRKPVIKYDGSGNEVCGFVSITAAAKDAGIRRDSMREHLKRLKLRSGKPYYREVGDSRLYTVGKKPQVPKPPIPYPEMTGGKFILDTKTGVFYYSVKELCELYPFKIKTMYGKLSGEKKNNTQFVYA